MLWLLAAFGFAKANCAKLCLDECFLNNIWFREALAKYESNYLCTQLDVLWVSVPT
jgi:hypothetical protein